MKIRIFGKEGCAKCQTTKNKFKHFITKLQFDEKVEIDYHDLESIDGRAEGAYNDVSQVVLPTTIIEKDGEVLARWEGEVTSDEIKEHLVK
ncbi:MAG: glutaredoxin family protein [Candidatus Omnitrophica bacterium]|nr:glutaredoxin family protein [Candidatus Omnitrophota bacterium]